MPSQASQFTCNKKCSQKCQEDKCDICKLNIDFNQINIENDPTITITEMIIDNDEYDNQYYENDAEEELDYEQFEEMNMEQEFENEGIKQKFSHCDCCHGYVYSCSGEICQHLGYCHCYAHYINDIHYEKEQQKMEEIFQDYKEMEEIGIEQNA